MPKKVTLHDVATLANVAIGTASQVLNNKGKVLPETRERVIEAARQLGYDRRFVFSTRENEIVKTIGVIKLENYDRPGINPFYFPIISGVEQECRQRGFSMIYSTIEVDEHNRATRLAVPITKGRFEGLVVIGTSCNQSIIKQLNTLKCPIVLVDGYSDGNVFDSVLTNNKQGACQAVSYLIENGHRHIGLIGSSPDAYPSILERRSGYLSALHQHGISDIYIEDGLLNRESAHEATLTLLKKHSQITALFVCNDNAAFGAINAARSVGYIVPGTLSIIGFDNIAFAQDMVPPLTTMHIDKFKLGELAVRQLLYRTENLSMPPMSIVVSTNLVIRESVRCI